MANINKIRVSGTTYNIQDINASKTVELTQAQYNALTTKDPNTYYIITDATPIDITNYYTKSEADDLLDDKADTATTYTRTVTNTLLSGKADTATTYTKTEVDTALGGKQATLVSGTNIKTVNNQSLLGSGNIDIQGGSVDVDSALSPTSENPVQNKVIYNKIDEVEEVTARALNELNDAVSGKADTATTYTKSETNTLLGGKQATLVSGTNIKTINNESILGSGNIDIQGGSTYTAGRGISIANDTISFSLPISAGTGMNSVIEGYTSNKASGGYSHAEGQGTTASGTYSHAEGYNTTASGYTSHAEGYNTKANGNYSHAEGHGTVASGNYSNAEGLYTTANNTAEHASGQYNVSSKASTTWGDSGNTLFSVGNGTSPSARHNAFEIRQNGDIYLTKDGQDVKLQDQLGGSSITVDSALSSTSENPVQNKVIYNKIDEVEQVTAAGLNALNDKIGDIETLLSQI